MSKRRLLIVEDEMIVARDIADILERLGYEICATVFTGAEAIEQAERVKPDLILMDIVLQGGMDGVEVANRIRQRSPIPVIYLTAHADGDTLGRAKVTGPFGYVLKPFEERELRVAVELALYKSEMERKLTESEEKYRALVENANDAIFIVQDGVIKFPNPKTKELGYSSEELGSIPYFNHIHPNDREMVMERDRRRMSGEKLTGTYSYRILNKNGEEVWVESNAVPILWEGKPAVLNFLRDITERKRIEAQFPHAQKMEAIGQLAGVIAHDFNNSLTLIKVCAQLSLLELKKGDPLRENIKKIDEAAEGAANLASKLLAFSRRQIMDMKVLDLNHLLMDLDKMLRPLIGENIELTSVLANDLNRIKADPAQIEQVILNLVLNARDAMPGGGKLKIKTANIELDDQYAREHKDVIAGRYVMVSVRDTGVGMPPEVIKRIFEPFFTNKDKGKGTGLGLASVYGIVKQSEGHIEVESEPGRGTKFKIYLPQVDEPLEERKRISAEKIPRGQETILVVENDPQVSELVVQILKKQGYRVLRALSGDEAFRVREQFRGEVHMLLTDIGMPGITGPEIARRLKLFYPELRVLFMSGYTEDPIVAHGFLKEGINFIPKPFSVEGMARKVREILDY